MNYLTPIPELHQEIERLKLTARVNRNEADLFSLENDRLKTLITELADKIAEDIDSSYPPDAPLRKLIQKAREAVK